LADLGHHFDLADNCIFRRLSLCRFVIWISIEAYEASDIFTAYVIFRLVRHRREFRSLMSHTNSALTTSRFIRLACISAAHISINLPTSAYFYLYQFTVQLGAPLEYNWAEIHKQARRFASLFLIGANIFSQWDIVFYLPPVDQVTVDYWMRIVSGVLVLVFFGFGEEARSIYVKFLRILTLGWLFERGGRSSTGSALGTVTKIHLAEPTRYVELFGT
jgi:pheromone a factor receptor